MSFDRWVSAIFFIERQGGRVRMEDVAAAIFEGIKFKTAMTYLRNWQKAGLISIHCERDGFEYCGV